MRSLAVASTSVALLLGVGCDSSPRGSRDASQEDRIAEISVRMDAPNGGYPSVSVLAYRAAVSGVGADEVLSVIDPLMLPPPGDRCSARDIADSARTLGAQAGGGRVELSELSGLKVDVGMGLLQPAARVFPDLASVVSGVIGEVGPVDYGQTPTALALVDSAGNRTPTVPVAELPQLFFADGTPLPPSPRFAVHTDLELRVKAAPGSFVELRPFGATWALSCPLNQERVVVPAAELAKMAALRVPVSLEAVGRDSHPYGFGADSVRLTIEVRTSSVVELLP